MGGNTYCWASYPRLVQLAHEMFPAIEATEDEPADEDTYSTFNFWRLPLPALPPEGEAAAARANAPSTAPVAAPTAALAAPVVIEEAPSVLVEDRTVTPSVERMDE